MMKLPFRGAKLLSNHASLVTVIFMEFCQTESGSLLITKSSFRKFQIPFQSQEKQLPIPTCGITIMLPS